MTAEISIRLLAWYASNARALPWRVAHPDPYAVWVSEIMLQQTRVETVGPYFARWMARFSNIEALAAAPLQDVLAAWEGLGYYSRARNLQRAAQLVVERHGGRLPANVAHLRQLPGIGRYTAGAIASIAFGQDEPALDGNIRRVLARLFNLTEDARSPQGLRRLWELAALILPPGRAGDHNQALMDLGSLICTPRAPLCHACPLAELCQARALGVQAQRPVLAAKPASPHYTVTAAVIQRGGQVLLAQRPQNGLLGGLWEFPGGKQQDGEDLPACLRREIDEELGVAIEVGPELGVYRHAFTHFRITLHAFCCQLLAGQPRPIQAADIRWVTPVDLETYPMGKVDRQIAKKLLLEAKDGSCDRLFDR
ncbi:MAG TPA: A/G-specific adenine glycosylase [Anaerolineales bacterium]|nr:A/G-specific adenine glycosylase [Anaerolineales bacterium]